jgi:hypothetical protein
MSTGSTEYSYTIPDNVKRIEFKLRAINALLQYTFTSGESGSAYITVPYGETITIEDAKLGGKVLYVQSPTASQTLETRVWV